MNKQVSAHEADVVDGEDGVDDDEDVRRRSGEEFLRVSGARLGGGGAGLAGVLLLLIGPLCTHTC